MQIYFQQNNSPTFQAIDIPREQLEALLAKDKTIEQIARKLGASGKTIRSRIKEYNLQLPSEKLRERFQNEALPLIEQGLSTPAIRKLTGIPEGYIKMWKHNNNPSSFKEIREQRIIELFNQNKTDEDIADILCMSEATITRKRQKLGCHKTIGRPPQITSDIPILKELKNGATTQEIADKYNISAKTITEYLKKNEQITPKKIQIENKKNLIASYLSKGYSVKQVADELGENKGSIYNFMKRFLPEWIEHRKNNN